MDTATSSYNLTEVEAGITKNKVMLVTVIKVEDYNCVLSNYGVTSIDTAEDDIVETAFSDISYEIVELDDTSIVDQLGSNYGLRRRR